MDVEEYKKDLLELDIEDVYVKYIISGEVWYFRNQFNDKWYEEYDKFKLFISKKLNVHYNDIAIAGSAKLGFSINPRKNYKSFDDTSDIDIIIVSQSLFYKFWRSCLEEHYKNCSLSYANVSKCILRKFLLFDDFLKNNIDYIQWKKKTAGFEKDLQLQFKISNEITYRIFESWKAAEMYYLAGMSQNKSELEASYFGNH